MRKQHRWWWRKQRKNLVPTENPSSRRKQRHRRPRRPRQHRPGHRRRRHHPSRQRRRLRQRLRGPRHPRHLLRRLGLPRRRRQHRPRQDPQLPRARPPDNRKSSSGSGKRLGPRLGQPQLHRLNPRPRRRLPGSRRSSSGNGKGPGPRADRQRRHPQRRPQALRRRPHGRALRLHRTLRRLQPHPPGNRARRLRERLRWCAARRRR
jgi:hypothetical protein